VETRGHGVGADLTTKPNRGRSSPYALENRWVEECGLVTGVSDSVAILDVGGSTCRAIGREDQTEPLRSSGHDTRSNPLPLDANEWQEDQ
jgi:hypothetical protein